MNPRDEFPTIFASISQSREVFNTLFFLAKNTDRRSTQGSTQQAAAKGKIAQITRTLVPSQHPRIVGPKTLSARSHVPLMLSEPDGEPDGKKTSWKLSKRREFSMRWSNLAWPRFALGCIGSAIACNQSALRSILVVLSISLHTPLTQFYHRRSTSIWVDMSELM